MASSYASSRVREVEHRSSSACKYEPSAIAITDEGWKIHSSAGDNDFSSVQIHPDKMADYAAGGTSSESIMTEGDDVNGTKLVKCQMLAAGTSIRVAPMERSCGGWAAEHFHEHLRLPEGSPAGKGMVIMLEAMGRECIAVALSPYHAYELGKTYVVHLGANGNLQTVLRRHMSYQECVDCTFPCRVCAEDTWIPYWIVLQGGKLSAGVGRMPGKNCIGTLDDSMYNMLRSGVDAVKYVGIGNSALQRSARDLRVRGVMVSTIPPHFGLEGIPIEESKFVNILEMGYGGQNGGGGAGGDGAAPTDAELLAEYEKERAKARARAEKFGIEYKEPPPDAFLKWSEARRLRANPERGFITGIDTFSAPEKAKADARKERFARDERKRKGLDPDGDDDGMKVGGGEGGGDGEEAMEDDGVDDVAEWEKTKKDPLPINQAWENWKLVKQFRVDPPAGLLVGNGDGMGDLPLSENGGEVKEFIPRNVVIVPTKIHIFSIDWAPFKQIRTDDLMSYFRDYGPSYVEWLGELSCNVLFEDKHSAARAFHALSQELPSPPPESLTNPPDVMEEIKERWTPPAGAEANVMDEIKDRWTNEDDEGEEKETMDATNNNDDGAEKEAMDATNNDEGAKAASTSDNRKQQNDDEPLPDFGGMGWRFCKWTVRKVSNDRYGRRGTRARLLMRLATSIDVLDDRPTEWPKPPPGFTTKRVLMPWHDFSGKRHHRGGRRDTKRRRRGSGGGRSNRGGDDDYAGDDYAGGEHPGLSTGLRSSRPGGFSVEELEAERNAKHAEILTS
ncbi:hypothetical protein ACHAXR_012358 [Thalassiosira sp. AJA248-18]